MIGIKAEGCKVKIFTCGFTDEPTDLEDKMNEWLKANPTVELVTVLMGETGGVNVLGKGYINISITILYYSGKETYP